jgi:hypothetical protein
MSKVIERVFKADGDFEDVPSSFEAAERIIGQTLDRRKNYAIIYGEVCDLVRFTRACSGCYEGNSPFNGGGNGCHECGYTGRRRSSSWVHVLRRGEE